VITKRLLQLAVYAGHSNDLVKCPEFVNFEKALTHSDTPGQSYDNRTLSTVELEKREPLFAAPRMAPLAIVVGNRVTPFCSGLPGIRESVYFVFRIESTRHFNRMLALILNQVKTFLPDWPEWYVDDDDDDVRAIASSSLSSL
jgi:hypothetical protein